MVVNKEDPPGYSLCAHRESRQLEISFARCRAGNYRERLGAANALAEIRNSDQRQTRSYGSAVRSPHSLTVVDHARRSPALFSFADKIINCGAGGCLQSGLLGHHWRFG